MEFCVFSKLFQSMDADALGRTMKELGVDGVDLTVRRGGHVEPESVKEGLPAFQQALAAHDIKVSMLTTSITGRDEPHAVDVIEAAGRLGIGYIKLGYWRYKGFGTYKESERQIKAALEELTPVLKDNGVKAGMHTHSGKNMGLNAQAALTLIEDSDPEAVGVFYDGAHCVFEGGYGGWLMGLDMVADRLFMVAVKDGGFFRTGSPSDSQKGWMPMVVPLDAGMMDWVEFIRCLKEIGFAGPLSFHSEYQGWLSFREMNVEQITEQTRKDLAYFRSLMAD
ncbi:MAG: sugar phosphate isomerase/epimerase [Candidatus Brocadiae bacterium]|nr:sugar phosphate isomerase/epimerase [Candidatus Brocadiia bacterium]